MRRIIILVLGAVLMCGALACNKSGDDGSPGVQGDPGPPGPQGPPGPGGDPEPVTAVETCMGCHGPMGVVPVGDIMDPADPHFIDTHPSGPETAAGYRQLVVTITEVDVTGTEVGIEFDVEDENGAPVSNLFAGDGRFSIVRLDQGSNGDPDVWFPFITRTENPGVGPGTTSQTQGTAERFTSSGGSFQNNGGGSYSYASSFDPTSVPVADGDTLRVAIQLSAGDLPAGNGWCDFDADTSSPNDCTSGVSVTRDIVQTATCNGCHGVTSDTKLALHGGGRTDVEYCVTCHNPTTFDANSGNSVDMPVLIHKIHYGGELENGYMIYGFGNNLHDYSNVEFTKNIDDCTNCHTGGGADEDNWSMVPTLEACGSCHDDVDFATGTNHVGGVQTDNRFCSNCHPATGPLTQQEAPIETVHRGVERRMEGSRYTGGSNGFRINDVDVSGNQIMIDWEVRRDGAPMNVQTAPEWTQLANRSSRLNFSVGWTADDYTNEGTSEGPAGPVDINALDFTGGTTVALGGNEYRSTGTLPNAAEETVGVAMDGHPSSDLDGDGTFSDRIAVKNAVAYLNVDGGRGMTVPRRDVVDTAKCNQCHDHSGNGLSLHGQNRTGDTQVCVICHNANNTDIDVRPDDPMTAADGKKEEAIDFKRLIHQIHSGAELEDGLVVYGFGGSVHDYGTVEFIGNRQNCETCHYTVAQEPGAYGTMAAADGIPTTIDSGPTSTPDDPDTDPDDDLNISPITAVCSSCHDSDTAKDHMKLHGASFQALDADIL